MTFPAVAGGANLPDRARPWDRRRYIHFYGEAFGNAAQNYSFDVLAGDQPPTVVDGYAQWEVVQLPLRVGVITFTGYAPISMQLSVRFMLFDANGTWLTGNEAGKGIEEQITILEWMAGVGVAVGPSPIVFLSTYDAAGRTNPLIPFNYQNDTPNVPAFFGDRNYAPRWVINGLSWDASPIRNASGFRIRQDATVTATMYVAPGGKKNPRGTPRPKGRTVVSRAGADTALKIARLVPSQDPSNTALAIIQAPQNAKLQLRSVNQQIRHGKRVFVPASRTGSDG